MNKTKVQLCRSLFDYHQATAQWVDDLRDEKLRIVARVETNVEPFTERMDIPVFETGGLLTPPCIEALVPVFYLLEDGQIEGIINLVTSDYFGITSLHLALRDESGNLLEQGDAIPDENCLGAWAYLPQVVLAVGASVIVRAVAADALGGMSIAEEQVTLTDEYLRKSASWVEWGNHK